VKYFALGYLRLFNNEKKALGGDANTARWSQQKFAPPQTPFPEARDGKI